MGDPILRLQAAIDWELFTYLVQFRWRWRPKVPVGDRPLIRF